MAAPSRLTAGLDIEGRKPRDIEIDAFGLTHPGKVRTENQDHFLLAALQKQLVVYGTSLPDEAKLPVEPERLAFLALVADGVGSGAGEVASRMTVEAISRYVAESTHAYYTSDATDPDAFAAVLQDAALRCHGELVEHAQGQKMATTLTLYVGVWPQAYILQVGDSRCYMMRDDRLTQISRDQTMAQDLVDEGVLTRTAAHSTKWAHVLSSAIGGHQAAPAVTRFEQSWGSVGLICSDGLTKHVSDERIAEHLSTMTNAKQVCEDLLQEALDGGGTDNITIIVGRTIKTS
jgi:protein phosphatase